MKLSELPVFLDEKPDMERIALPVDFKLFSNEVIAKLKRRFIFCHRND
jgi:hypothetical protein